MGMLLPNAGPGGAHGMLTSRVDGTDKRDRSSMPTREPTACGASEAGGQLLREGSLTRALLSRASN